MANLARRTPYAVDNLFDDLMKGFLIRPVPMSEPAVQIKLDVKEDDHAYTVHADMPGVKKEDIHVHVDGGMVTIEAEIKRETEQKAGEKVVHSERYFGKTSRSFTLAQDIDDSKAKAKLDNGVLELVLPKKVATNMRKLTVE